MDEKKVCNCETGVPCEHCECESESIAMTILRHYKANYYVACIYGIVVTAILIGVLIL
jgi:hypothetical protein